MKKKLLLLLLSLASLALVSCGGGNDIASSGASAVSAAAPTTASVSPAVTSPLSTIELKVNGQIDERTGVAPMAAQMTIWTVYSNGGCANSSSFGGWGQPLTSAQMYACEIATMNASTNAQCSALGGTFYICRGCYLDAVYVIC